MAQGYYKLFCFMVMPFGTKKTQAESDQVPAEIDFNALWDKAYFPLLKELGYEPVRADQETGSLIINQMLERLYFSDLVIAGKRAAGLYVGWAQQPAPLYMTNCRVGSPPPSSSTSR